MAETEPILKRVDDIPKKLDLILEQLTVLSGVEAKAPRIEKSNARKQSAEKRQKDSDARAFKMFSKTMEENNRLLQKQLDMAAAAKKMQEKSEAREKKNAKDINRKGKEVASPQLEKLQKMTLDEQQRYWETKYKMEKQKAKIEKKILNKQKGNLFKRGGKKLLSGAKGASGDILGEAVSDIKPSNALMALGPVGMVAKMVLDSTGLGKKASGAMKKQIPTWLGGSKEAAKNTTKQQIKNVKQQKALERKLGGSKKNYIQQNLRGQLGYKVSDTGEISLDEEYLQKKAMGKASAPKAIAAPNTRKAVSNKKMKQEAKLLQTPQKKGNPTDQQMKNSDAGRPLLWFWRKQKEEGGGKGGKLNLKGLKGGGGGDDLISTILGTIGSIITGIGALAFAGTGIKKLFSGKNGKPPKGTPKGKAPAGRKPGKPGAKRPALNRKPPKTTKLPGKFGKAFGIAAAILGISSLASDTGENGGEPEAEKKNTQPNNQNGLSKIMDVMPYFSLGADFAVQNYRNEEDQVKFMQDSAQKLAKAKGGLSGIDPRMEDVLGEDDAKRLKEIIKFHPDNIKMWSRIKHDAEVKEEQNPKKKVLMGDGVIQKDGKIIQLDNKDNVYATTNDLSVNPRIAAQGTKSASNASKSAVAQQAMRQGFVTWTQNLFKTSISALNGLNTDDLARQSVLGGGSASTGGGGEGMYASRGWFRETQANRKAFNLANDAVEKPEEADDLLAGPKGNYTFNARDQHYVLPDGQVLSTNRGINTLPESKGIRDGRFASTNNTSNDNTEKLLQQILSALQNGSGGSPTVINNTTRLVSPENFVTGGVFT